MDSYFKLKKKANEIKEEFIMAHKVFISFHHENDQKQADYIRSHYGEDNTLIDRSLDEAYIGMTDEQILSAIRTEHLKDSTVTIVLIGKDTAKRKWVDWEVNSSLRPYGDRTVNGLLGIYLDKDNEVPARLQDNIDSGYAVTMNYSDISTKLKDKIEEAYNNRNKKEDIRNGRLKKQRNG